MSVEEDQQHSFHQLAYYTLAHPDPAFIHQNIVDAQTAQWANADTKPIAIAFALIGLYLYLEKGYTGKQVQQAHMRLAKQRKEWPVFELPEERGTIYASDVAGVQEGSERDDMIRKWCESVWAAYSGSREQVAGLVRQYLGI